MGCSTSSLDVRAAEKIMIKTSQSDLKLTVKTVKYRSDGKESERKGNNTVTGFRSPGKCDSFTEFQILGYIRCSPSARTVLLSHIMIGVSVYHSYFTQLCCYANIPRILLPIL